MLYDRCSNFPQMTSVLYSGGYNVAGNQLRVELRNTNARLDNLLKGLSSLEELFVKLHPDSVNEVRAAFQNVINPPEAVPEQRPNPTPLPPQRNTVQTAGVNRVRA